MSLSNGLHKLNARPSYRQLPKERKKAMLASDSWSSKSIRARNAIMLLDDENRNYKNNYEARNKDKTEKIRNKRGKLDYAVPALIPGNQSGIEIPCS
ncbi:hypothetical protein CEXT_347571 [Caerostris extrusa]|uniref:Uncharacterized protein n=1 Tax=Caerostris extrusa TaxID=172846 RepID=A0AAV4S5K2_CAEEX|nr:hypothetical protein CEXT_347571 [Caerostris extrusa]